MEEELSPGGSPSEEKVEQTEEKEGLSTGDDPVEEEVEQVE